MPGIAACLYVRNAERDIQEWIAYHQIIGVQAFLIYDNGSIDTTVAQAQAMISVTDVRIVLWDQAIGPGAQMEAYEDCFRRFQKEFDWIIVLDSDEFISSSTKSRIDTLLSKHFFHAAIAFNWACFGSNGHIEVPKQLTIEAFTRRSDETFGANRHTKFMVRPELVKNVVNPHYFDVDGPIRRANGQQITWNVKGVTENVDLSDWRVNHYFTRSYAQWEAKLARGYRDYTVRDKNLFYVYDRNEIVDQTAAAHADMIRSLLEQAGKQLQEKSPARRGWFSRMSGLLKHSQKT